MKIFMKLSFLLIALCFSVQANAQRKVSGKVIDDNNEALVGASVIVKGTSTGALTDVNGQYTVTVPNGASTLIVSFVGYATKEIAVAADATTADVTLETGESLGSLVVIGSRSTASRTKTETVAPVDVLTSKDLQATGQTEPTQMLHYVVPSFNSGRQTVADGTDHIDPSTLRGLGPDQVLTLLNGKRRHNQALININGTIGRGSVGTDMNAIPAAAIDRLEVLRDGAASQYGSDAIAGVINVVMKTAPGTSVTGHVGAYNTQYENKFGSTDKRQMNDGETVQLSAYHGMAIGKGKLGIALEFRDRKASNRTGDFLGSVYTGATKNAVDDSIIAARGGFDRTFNMQVGNAASRNMLGFVNFTMPFGEKNEFYANIGGALRNGSGKGFYRYPKQVSQVNADLYPKGFLPEIHSTIGDISALLGAKGTIGNGWRWDLSNVFGSNSFRYDIKNTNNASQFDLKASAPTAFYAGTQKFAQNTSNLDISKSIETSAVNSLNIAFGGEFRLDNFQIEAGEEASWKNYAPSATPARVGGAQVFPGFQPDNAVNESRTVLGAYVDVESDITEKLLLNAAVRVENYSDFGANAAAKLAGRYKISDGFALRGSISNGFRAPSAHQRYFSNVSTQFIVAGGVTTPNNVGTYRNDSKIAQSLGIVPLKAETSMNYSFGVTSKFAEIFSLTVDAYQIDIKDRIVITGNMNRGTNALINTLLTAGGADASVTQVAFFTNAITTKTRGIDAVLSASSKFGEGVLDLVLAANFTKNEIIGDPKTTDKLPVTTFGNIFFNKQEESRITVGQPQSKIAASVNYKINGFNINLRATNFGEVAVWDNSHSATNSALDETFSAKTIFDATVSYKYKVATLTLGGNNLTDIYPDKIKTLGNTSDGRFIYSRNVSQFGFGGRYVYAALRVDF